MKKLITLLFILAFGLAEAQTVPEQIDTKLNVDTDSISAVYMADVLKTIYGDVSNNLDNKVIKVAGKSLSTNDYTDADKANLEGNTGKVGITQSQDDAIESIAKLPISAIGDGVADDTDALNAWINSGNNLYLPSGTYKVSDEILSNTPRENLIITGSPDALIVATSDFNQAKALIRIDSVSNLIIDRMRIESNADTAVPEITTFGIDVDNIKIQDCENVTIQNCVLTKALGAAIETKNVNNLKIINNTCPKVENYVFRVYGGENILIRDNTASGKGLEQHDATTVGQTPGIMATLSKYVIIEGNNINDFKNTGTKTEGCEYVTYSKNTVRNVGKDGIKVQGYGGARTYKAIVVNNHVENLHPYAPDGSSLITVQDCSEFVIQGNIVSGGVREGDTGSERGITVLAGGGTFSKLGNVIGNVISNVGDDGIYLEECSFVNVSNNSITDYAVDRENANGIYAANNVDDCRIINNTISMTTRLSSGFGYGIDIAGSNHQCTGNTITNPNEGGISYDITDSDFVDISNNTIINPNEHGITIKGTATIGIIKIDNNYIKGNQGYFCYIFKNDLSIDLLTFRNNSFNSLSGISRNIIESSGSGSINRLDVSGTNTVGVFSSPGYVFETPEPTIEN